MATSENIIKEYYRECQIHRKGYTPLDRKEIYEYEESLGKSIFEMSANELMDLFAVFKRRKVGDSNIIPYNTYCQYVSEFRGLFQWYCEHYQVIINHFNTKDKFNYNKLVERANQNKEIVSPSEYYNSMLASNRISSFTKMVNQLAYLGLSIMNIITLTDDMVDLDARTIQLRNRSRVIPMPDDLYYRMLNNHNEPDENRDTDGNISLHWRESFLSFRTRAKPQYEFDKLPDTRIRMITRQKVAKECNKELGCSVSLEELQRLGFYDFLVSKYGREEANELISDPANTNKFNREAFYYGGFNENTLTRTKRDMVQFIYQK